MCRAVQVTVMYGVFRVEQNPLVKMQEINGFAEPISLPDPANEGVKRERVQS